MLSLAWNQFVHAMPVAWSLALGTMELWLLTQLLQKSLNHELIDQLIHELIGLLLNSWIGSLSFDWCLTDC